MAKQMMFYEKTVPVSAERHREWSIEEPADYRFAGESSAVPIAAVEFPAAASEYAIVFVGEAGALTPAAILGIKGGDNLYLDEQGQWSARYMPAFVRRYPFVFANTEEGDRLLLCIDEDYAGCNQDGRGKRLFDVNGDRTEYLKSRLGFLEDYQRQAVRAQAFCRKLEELELLELMTARFKLPSGHAAALGGFNVVSREKLNALPGEQLSELARSGALELVYLHLHSMRNLASVIGRLPEDFEMGEAAPEAGANVETPES